MPILTFLLRHTAFDWDTSTNLCLTLIISSESYTDYDDMASGRKIYVNTMLQNCKFNSSYLVLLDVNISNKLYLKVTFLNPCVDHGIAVIFNILQNWKIHERTTRMLKKANKIKNLTTLKT